jgi:FG-GAP-like repeat
VRALVIGLLFVGAGCSAIYDGHDLMGTSHAGGSGKAGGGGGAAGGGGTGGGGTAGGGGSGGGGTTGTCTPLTTVKFTATTPSTVDKGPYETALADIDGDGKADIVSANYDSNSFSVLLGAGNGTFALADSTPVMSCTNPNHLAVADLTGDGLADVVVECWDGTTSGVDVYVNQSTAGTVKFSAAFVVPLPLTTVDFFPMLGKFKNDGFVDLALLGNSELYIAAGSGTGIFPASTRMAGGIGSASGAFADLNGDGFLDFITYDAANYDLSMVLSIGGSYTITQLAYDKAAMDGTVFHGSTPLLTDYDHDGLTDIVISQGTSDTGVIFFFKNSGTKLLPSFPITGVELDIEDLPIALAMGDFNCDGKDDFVTSTNGCSSGCDANSPPEIGISLAHGTSYDPPLITNINDGCYTPIVADLNGDGYLDVLCSASGNTVSVLLNTP